MSELPSGTVTLLFTDVEGSTRLLRELGADYEQALRDHRRLLGAAFEQWNGRVVDVQGDAFLVAFGSARDAVAAAAEAQRALAAHAWPQERPVRVRMGIHTGEPTLTDDGYYVGLDVHRGARICAAGHGGQVLVSRATYELVGDEPLPDARLRDLGNHLLKDLPAPERLFRLEPPGFTGGGPPPRSLQTTNLPLQATRLIDRAEQLAHGVALLSSDDVRLVTCTGPGGTGKTRLALQLGAEVADAFADGVYFVALAPVADAAHVAAAVAVALGLRDTAGRGPEDALKEHVQSREILLLLDNFEHVVAAAPLVAELLGAAAGLKVLATSRAPLRIAGERELHVPPLPLSAGVELFADRASLVRRDDAVVEEICRRVDSLPLAIELAAARTNVLAPPELLQLLTHRLDVLTHGARDAPERQRTLRQTLAWSNDLLTPGEQKLLAEMSVFAGGATLEAIDAVCECDQPVALLTALVENSLLQRTEAPLGTTRFTLLETVREFAAEQLELLHASEEVRRRHAEFFLAEAKRAEPELTAERQARWLVRLEAEYANLRAAVLWLLEHDRADDALALVSALTRFWRARGHIGEVSAWLDRGLAADAAVGDAVRAQALWTRGRLAMAQSDFVTASRCYEQALPLFRFLGAGREQAFTLAELGQIAAERGDYARAEELSQEAVDLARRLDDPRALAAALNNLGTVMTEQSEHGRARDLYEEALAVRRSLNDPLLIANSALNLSIAALAAHDLVRAFEAASEAVALARSVGDRPHTAAALCCLGEAALLDHRPDEARPPLAEGLLLYVELQDRRGAAECLHALAGVAASVGDSIHAARLWGAAETLRHALAVSAVHEAELEIAMRLVGRAVADVGEEAFEAARAEGRSLSLQAAASAAADRGATRASAGS